LAEKDTVAAVPAPVTQAMLLEGLRALGIRPGDTLIVHSAMSKIGWVCGKEETVVRALLAAVGCTGTLVMPAHSGDNSEPSDWRDPPVPDSWFAPIRENMPAYNRHLTPTRGMGRVAECFRRMPGTRRSAHPHVSWCARGLGAAWLLRGHTYRKPCFGMRSPLGRLYRRNAKILLLGVGYGNCTALHMAETLYPNTPKMDVGAAVRVRGKRRWVRWQEIDMDSDRFPQIGEAYELSGGEAITGMLGAAECKALRVRPLVDFGVEWLAQLAALPEALDAGKAGE
jgi:aminoglycoside 3-N-acetyltransferase